MLSFLIFATLSCKNDADDLILINPTNKKEISSLGGDKNSRAVPVTGVQFLEGRVFIKLPDGSIWRVPSPKIELKIKNYDNPNLPLDIDESINGKGDGTFKSKYQLDDGYYYSFLLTVKISYIYKGKKLYKTATRNFASVRDPENNYRFVIIYQVITLNHVEGN